MKLMFSFILCPGGHAHTRIILHEPEASSAIYQENHEEIPRRDRSRRAGSRPDPARGF